MTGNSNTVGIESMNAFCGLASLDVNELAQHRRLDVSRFENLLMKEKTVALPYEDAVTYAVNAAKPLIDSLTPEMRERIELLIVCSESGIDFSKSISTYVHKHLKLNNNCRMFEIKQACYAGTAGLQMAANFILSQSSPGAKALVIASDLSRFILETGDETALTADWSYAEPSGGSGAVALLVGDQPEVLALDVGANGYYGYEVMDTCRPAPESETGNADLSLMSYLDCCKNTFQIYCERVADVDYCSTFDRLAFHTPFGGMVKGAHRSMMRKFTKTAAADIETDFNKRVWPGLNYCQRVGNIMGGTLFLSLLSSIDSTTIDAPLRIGCFSYGSGCCSEFYSGVVSPQGAQKLKQFHVEKHLKERYRLSMEEYERVLTAGAAVKFGVRNVKVDSGFIAGARDHGWSSQRLFLKEVKEYYREYEWL